VNTYRLIAYPLVRLAAIVWWTRLGGTVQPETVYVLCAGVFLLSCAELCSYRTAKGWEQDAAKRREAYEQKAVKSRRRW
jgi:hypothetical protein